jgi:hypothetical protein
MVGEGRQVIIDGATLLPRAVNGGRGRTRRLSGERGKKEGKEEGGYDV